MSDAVHVMGTQRSVARALAAILAMSMAACEVSRPIEDAGAIDSTVDDADLDPAPCVSSTDCLACTSSASCGWCGATAQCVTGTMSGPSAGGCPTTSWTWLPMTCPGQGDAGDPGQVRVCESAKACSTCADLVGCGWCATRSQCLAGSETGATGGACSGADWVVSTASCR